ncbi:MAG: hypothetical protein JXA78_12355 [Anaerolineales bacterium]|nr:hypothetical protein [Anaerolineales bacterium]
MKRLRYLTWLSLASALSVLILGFAGGGYWVLSCIPIALAILWLIGVRYERRWLVNLVVLAFFIATVAISVLGISIIWLILGAHSLLLAWDLQYFTWRMQPAVHIEAEEQAIQRHLGRIAAICALGCVLSLAALLLRLRLGFGVIVLLGLLAILGLRQGIHLASRPGE